jgi:cephalosporin-C deacetylase-like acetyl esterase
LKDQIVITGQSQGGWAALAASKLEMQGVVRAVNISSIKNFKLAPNQSIR